MHQVNTHGHHIYKFDQTNGLGADEPQAYSMQDAKEASVYRTHDNLINSNGNDNGADEHFGYKSKKMDSPVKLTNLKHELNANDERTDQSSSQTHLLQKKYAKDKTSFKKTKENTSSNTAKSLSSSRKLYQKKIKVMIMKNSTNHDLVQDASDSLKRQFCEAGVIGSGDAPTLNGAGKKQREKKFNSKKLLSSSSTSTSTSSSCSSSSASSQINPNSEELLLSHQGHHYGTLNASNEHEHLQDRQNVSLVLSSLNAVSIAQNSSNDSSNMNNSLNNSSKHKIFILFCFSLYLKSRDKLPINNF